MRKEIGLLVILMFSWLFLFAQDSFRSRSERYINFPGENLNGIGLTNDSSRSSIKNIIRSANEFSEARSVEKLYLHTDKSNYSSGDTLWFKAYLFDASYLHASAKSGVMYVEIANDSNRVLKRIMLPVFGGLSFNQFVLDEKEIPAGTYTLRAYTNWMRNFGESYVFKKHFYISDPSLEDWLVSYETAPIKEADRQKVRLGLRITRLDGVAVGLREMQLELSAGKKTLYKSKRETSIDGLMDVVFDPLDVKSKSNGSHRAVLEIQDLRKGAGNKRLTVPVVINRPNDIDLQFMPEGGNLVADLSGRIAFKAVYPNGAGANIKGKIFNSRSEEIATFEPAHRGLGSFTFLPRLGETYSARIILPDGTIKSYALPDVKPSGIAIKVNNTFGSDSCDILIDATREVVQSGKSFFIMGEARGVVCYGAAVNFSQKPVKLRVDKKIFPTGVVRFTLLNQHKNPVNERLIFIDHQDQLNFLTSFNKSHYTVRDSVSLKIKVTDKNGNPVSGSFSAAVTDDGQVRSGSLSSGSISSRILLESDLKGVIEEPGYYLKATLDEEKWHHLDLLLLTQGWVGYDWKDVFKPSSPFPFAAEAEFEVKGMVTNAFNRPVVNSKVSLLSKKPFTIRDTLTNVAGEFEFKGIFPVDTAVFFIQARNKNGKSFNVGIEMQEFRPPVFSVDSTITKSWFANIDTGNFFRLNKQLQLKKNYQRITGRNMLKEVVVRAKRIIKESKNLNGPGEADVIISEEILEKAGRASLEDLLRQHIKGFGYRASKTGQLYYQINGLSAHLIIDGIDTEFFLPEGASLYQHLKTFMDYYDAEEIKGIEVMFSGKYQMRYSSTFLSPMNNPFEHAFIEVTTHGGKGPFMKKAVGTYLYRPMAFSSPKQFYSPKYKTQSVSDQTDIRSTVFWKADIVTDNNGEAELHFYTSDITGSYSLIVAGSDMQGSIGSVKDTIIVRK